MDIFKIKQKFYYKNINNQSNYYLKKKTCNTCIRIDTFKIKHNFYIKI